MVGTQMAVPRASAMIFSTSSGFMGSLISRFSVSDRGQADENGGGTAALATQAVVCGNVVDVVGPFEARVRHAEHVEQRLAEANHGLARLERILVLLAAQEADHVEDR